MGIRGVSEERIRISAKRCACVAIAAAALFSPLCVQLSWSQSTEQAPPISELERRNMSLAAASAAQIKDVLARDPGMMVEVKRWIAKEASDRGQIIVASDLSESAISDCLENDIEFRSAVTLIVQHFGYLLPHVDPGSAAAKEQDLLVQERVKWIEQFEQQQRMRNMQDFQAAQACATGTNDKCSSHPSQPSAPQPTSQPAQSPDQDNLPQINPSQPAIQQLLANPDLQRAALTRLSGSDGDLSSLGLSGGSSMLRGALDGIGGASLLSSSMLSSISADEIGDFLSGSSLGGDLGANLGSESANANDASVAPTLDSLSPAHPSGTPMFPGAQASNSAPQGSRSMNMASPPGMVRVSSPYNDVPSLYDMYLQAAPHASQLERFGSDVFENGTRDPQLVPTDMPASAGYIVGAGDGLTIDLWGSVAQRLQRTVDREGRIALPDAAPLLVSGKTLAQIQTDLQQTLRHVYRDESADVSLSHLRTIRIYEVGDVQRPGAYDISSLSTPLNALFAAGGPTDEGSLRTVKHYRGNQLVEQVDLYNLLINGIRANMQPLEDGDTLLIPPVGPQVTIEGIVRRPAIYELGDERSLSSVLELAGGLLSTAALRHIEVQRVVAHEKQTMLSIDIPDAANSTAVTQQLDAFKVQDGDHIRIFPIAPYNQDVVYLEGHILRPGSYSYKPDMRVSDLIASYKDLLPEPAAQYAEIIRLEPPDFHPAIESFSIADAIENPAASPLLKPMDTVRIFGKFDFEDRPSVSVAGDVRTPGTYPTTGQIHLSDAVHLAGGLAPDASTNDAQVFRYASDGNPEVFSVNLKAALAGDPAANISLEPRDRLLVHKTAIAADPEIVYLEGDVQNPGRYPLARNMTVADLIRTGGGLKTSANAQSADLTRYSYAQSGKGKLEAGHQSVSLAAALSGDPSANIPVHNGDVLTIREMPQWSDLGASIAVKGEVNDPGTYGIRPGEHLSEVIARAGGFSSSAYPYGAVLQREQVRDLETKQQDELVTRIREQEAGLSLLQEGDPKIKAAKDAALQQFQSTLDSLTANPPAGRMAIRISGDVQRWKNTSADIEILAGDTLTIPKRPGYVTITGQVFHPTAVAYRPSKSAKWYLKQSGGATNLANKKAVLVIRADGSIVGGKEGLFSDPFDTSLRPGDTILVPERALGGGPNWQTLFTAAQISTSVASTIFIALHY